MAAKDPNQPPAAGADTTDNARKEAATSAETLSDLQQTERADGPTTNADAPAAGPAPDGAGDSVRGDHTDDAGPM